jgi:hypothetical protein
MKFLMKVGDELDLNVSYDGGAVDGVGYEVPAVCADVISVDAAGIVEALALGEGVVNVTSAGAVIGSIVFSVLSQAAYDAQQAIRDGEKELVVGADEVPQAPEFSLVSTGTAIAYRTWEGTQPADAFDGNSVTFASSYLSNMNVTQALIGKQFGAPKQIKKVRFKGKTLPQQLSIEYSSDTTLAIYDGNQDLAALRGNWTSIQTVTVTNYEVGDGWQEVILPSYPAAVGIMIRPLNVDSVVGTSMAGVQWFIDRFRMYEVEFYE